MKINIKTTSGETFTIECSPNITIAELKELISQKSNIPVNQQRLVYRGRVLKDPCTLNSYECQDGHAIHLVRGQPQQEQQQQQIPRQPQSDLFGGIDPNIFQSPIFQNMLNNPQLIQTMMQNNPYIQQIAQNNPELAALLQDPEMIRRSIEIARNPSLAREMMRNTDRAMSNIESLPGGFDALRRLYTEVQRPLEQMTSQMNQQSTQQNPFSALFGQQRQQQSTQQSTQQQSNQQRNTTPLPNPWSTGTQSQQNPFMNLFNQGNLGSMPLPRSGMSINQIAQLMQNPYIQQMMQQILSDPTTLNMLINSNPMLAQMVQQFPMLRNLLSNPQFVAQVVQMQAALMNRAQQFNTQQQTSSTQGTTQQTTQPQTTQPQTTQQQTTQQSSNNQQQNPFFNPFMNPFMFNPQAFNQMMQMFSRLSTQQSPAYSK